MPNLEPQKQYPIIDFMKFVMACCVVVIHTSPLQDVSVDLNFWTQNCFVRIAVPFFFVASGFFLFRKLSGKNPSSVFQNYWMRIFRVYVIWTVIYAPILLWNILHGSQDITHALWITFRNIIFIASYFHLWFLHALLVAVPILAFFFHCNWKWCQILAFGGIGYSVLLLFTSYHPVYSYISAMFPSLASFVAAYASILPVPPTGLCFGALFVCLGAFACSENPHLSTAFLHRGCIISCLIFFAEGALVHHLSPAPPSFEAYLSLPFLSFFLFTSLCRIHLSPHPIYLEFRKMSALIFYAHPLFLFLTQQLQTLGRLPKHSLVTFGSTLLLSCFFAKTIIFLRNHHTFQFLRFLF